MYLLEWRYKNGWVESLVLRRKAKDFSIVRIRVIEQRARKVLGMLKRGIKFTPTQPDVKTILEKLKKNMI